MPAPKPFKWHFLNVAAVRDKRAFFAARYEADDEAEQESAVCGVLSFDGQWSRQAFDTQAVSLCLLREPDTALLMLSTDGRVDRWGGAGFSVEHVAADHAERLTMREIRAIGQCAYAVGMGRRVFRCNADGAWESIDAGVRQEASDDTTSGFNSIDGFSQQDIIAVGWDGDIWHFNGAGWQSLPSPTRLALNKVICMPDGYAYAVGQVGLILRGQAEHWEVIANPLTTRDFCSACHFRGSLYALSSHGLFVLDGEHLREVELPALTMSQRGRFSDVSATDEALWLVSDNMAIRTTDGVSWSEVACP